MIRKLLIFALFAAAWSVLRLLLRRLPVGGPPPLDGALVRDRVCQTFVPRSRALLVRDEDGEHFFCSEACRSAFMERGRATA